MFALKSEHDKEIPQLNNADQPMAPLRRATKHTTCTAKQGLNTTRPLPQTIGATINNESITA